MTVDVRDVAELRAVIGGLEAVWEAAAAIRELQQPRARRGQRFAGHDLSRMATIYGLASHVHRTSQATLVLIEAGHLNEAIPLVRLAYETALTAAWLAQSAGDHGVAAILGEHTRQRRNLRDNLLSSATETFRDSAPTIVDTDSSEFDHTVDNARRFDLICKDLTPGGIDAYVYYHAFSAFSHPSVDIADLYVQKVPGHDMPGFRSEPLEPHSEDTLLYFTAASMLWASRAYSYFTRSQDHRDQLRALARRLGIKDDLQLSPEYHRRHAKKEPRGRET